MYKRYYLLGILLALIAQKSVATTLVGTSFLSPRSQSTNIARDLVGAHRFEHLLDRSYVTGSITAEYTQTYRPRRIAEYFFSTNALSIAGSNVQERSENFILADYFGLSRDFSSVACLEPVMSNGIIDFNLFGGYKQWYFSIHAPVVRTKASFHINESIAQCDLVNNPYPALYMAEGEVSPAYTSWQRAMAGGRSYGDVEPLKFGKISCSGLSQTKLSDIQCILGYDLVKQENGHAGFNLRMGIPTGTRPDSEFLFEPIVGNGHHWELGLGFDGKGLIWEREGTQQTYLYFALNAVHLFKTKQRRSFDFFNNSIDVQTGCPQSGFGSRYILVKEFNADGLYDGTVLPAINVSTLCCEVWNSIQFDIALMFAYQQPGFGFDIGYNIFVRSREKICLNTAQFPVNKYAFKGVQNAFNPTSTQSNATIDGNVLQIALANVQTLPEQQALLADPNPPVFIQPSDLNENSAASPLVLTNKIFWYFYATLETQRSCRLSAYYGLGGEVEFEGFRPKWEQPNKDAIAQWGIWAKGGISWH